MTHIHIIQTNALDLDVPTPLIDVLLPLLVALNTPSSSSSARPLRPTLLLEALVESETLKRSGLFKRGMREQQDAQELWQLLVAAVEEEGEEVRKETQGGCDGWGARQSASRNGKEGLGLILESSSMKEQADTQQQIKRDPSSRVGMENPFEGRMAYRRSCQM